MLNFELISSKALLQVATRLFESLTPLIDRSRHDSVLRRRLLQVAWVISIFIMLVVSAAFVFSLRSATQSYKPGIVVSVILWALFFGVTALLFLPPKAIVTLFGFLLGSSISEAGSGTGLLSRVNEAILQASANIGAIVPNSNGNNEEFITILVWTFVIIVTLLCLPAFFTKEDSRVASSSTVSP